MDIKETQPEQSLVPVVVTVEPYKILCDYDEIRSELEARVEPFRGIVYDEDSIAEARKARAELNNLKKSISRARIDNARRAAEPITEFENRMYELEAVCSETANGIDRQIKNWTEQRLALCRQLQGEFVSRVRAELSLDEEFWRVIGSDNYPAAKLDCLTKQGRLTVGAEREIRQWVSFEQDHADLYEKHVQEFRLRQAKMGVESDRVSHLVHGICMIRDHKEFLEQLEIFLETIAQVKQEAKEIGRQEAIQAVIEAQPEPVEAPEPKSTLQSLRDRLHKPAQAQVESGHDDIDIPDGMQMIVRRIVFALPADWDDDRIDAALQQAFADRKFKSFRRILR